MDTDTTKRGVLRVKHRNHVIGETTDLDIGYIIDPTDTILDGRYMNLKTRQLFEGGKHRLAARIVDQVLRPGTHAADFDELDLEVLEHIPRA